MTDAAFDPKSRPGSNRAIPISAGAAAEGERLDAKALREPAGNQAQSGAPLTISGDLTIRSLTEVQKTIADRIVRGSDLILDMSGVAECDAAGLQLIYSLRRTAIQRRQRFHLEAVSQAIREMASAFGLQIHELSDTRVPDAADAGLRSTNGGL